MKSCECYDPLCEKHNPKSTDEWTAEGLKAIYANCNSWWEVAQAVNVKLAAEIEWGQAMLNELTTKSAQKDETLLKAVGEKAELEEQIDQQAQTILSALTRVGALETQLAEAQAAIEELHKILGKKRTEIKQLKTQLATASLRLAEAQAAIKKQRDDPIQFRVVDYSGTTALDAAIAEATDAAVQEMLLVKQNRDRDIAEATDKIVKGQLQAVSDLEEELRVAKAATKPLVDALESTNLMLKHIEGEYSHEAFVQFTHNESVLSQLNQTKTP